ncbi:MAG TPA: 3-hydroxyacyl-ACP dehydratase FabZ [Thermoanaerobaculia bacterium]|nr:3-hydroxyacyl-ACP dehydratase FabZ [Thermoanaerobaculia bacterium]
MSAWDIRWIQEVLPHRYPFLLVDRVLEIEPGKSIRALKNVSVNEEYFQGHFPGHPVMPGVLILEAMAQAGGILLLHDHPDRTGKLIYFTGVERARFRRPVVPGDQLLLEVSVRNLRRQACKLEARALVADKVAAEAVLMSAMVDR